MWTPMGIKIFKIKIEYRNTACINEKIELENAAIGMYLVRISDGQKSTIKLIVIH